MRDLCSFVVCPCPCAGDGGGGGSGGGDGSFLDCKYFSRMFDHLFAACAFFFFKVEISSRTLIPLLSKNQSTVAQRAETCVADCSLASCV